jgi:hypothetical protein
MCDRAVIIGNRFYTMDNKSWLSFRGVLFGILTSCLVFTTYLIISFDRTCGFFLNWGRVECPFVEYLFNKYFFMNIFLIQLEYWPLSLGIILLSVLVSVWWGSKGKSAIDRSTSPRSKKHL